MSDIEIKSKHNAIFWFHLFITLLAWVAPFLFSWYIILPIYLLVWIQFRVFNRCLMNAAHEMDDSNATFYTYLLHIVGVQHNVVKLKRFVRNELYLVLGLAAILWQWGLGFKPLFF